MVKDTWDLLLALFFFTKKFKLETFPSILRSHSVTQGTKKLESQMELCLFFFLWGIKENWFTQKQTKTNKLRLYMSVNRK